MVANEAAASSSFLESIKSFFSPSVILEKIRLYKDVCIDLGLYFAVGLATGFLVRKFSSFLVAVLLFIGILLILQHMLVITVTVHWDAARSILGIQGMSTDQAGILMFLQANILIVISYAIGFFLGLKLG